MLILVVMLISLLLFIPIGAQLLKISRQEVRRFANSDAQGINIARAGLVDTIAWFQAQNSGSPVSQNRPGSGVTGPALYPDAAFNPQGANTIDSSKGLVQEGALSPYEAENKLYYRYEVHRQGDGTTAGTFDPHAVHDVSGERVEGHSNGDGLVWYIESEGFVYRKKSSGPQFDPAQDVIVGRSRVATEISRLNVLQKVPSALIISDRANVLSIGSSCYVRGTGQGYAAIWMIGAMTNPDTIHITPITSIASTTTATIQINDIFGVSPYQLRSMSDFSGNDETVVPGKVNGSLIYINGNATFGASNPLKGGGILVVSGNLTITANSNSYFSGLVHVSGNANITGGATLTGCLVVRGTLTLAASGSSGATIEYDEQALNLAQKVAAKYREDKAVYHIFSAFK